MSSGVVNGGHMNSGTSSDSGVNVGATTLSSSSPPLTIGERYDRAVELTESSPVQAAEELSKLREDVIATGMGILSTGGSTETLDDVPTKSVHLLALEHYLALSCTRLPAMDGNGGAMSASTRLRNLRRACDLWSSFLQNMDKMEVLTRDERRQVEELEDMSSAAFGAREGDVDGRLPPPLPAMSRDAKIARFRAKQAAEQQRAKLQSLQQRRQRLGISSTEEMDGYDEEGLERDGGLQLLNIAKMDAVEEWSSTLREVPMLRQMQSMQAQQQHQQRHIGNSHPGAGGRGARHQQNNQQPRPLSAKPLQLTHITQDASTGQLQIRKEEMKSKVFQKGWNQPTMTLEELGEREVQQAIERGERQRAAEEQQKHRPRRYDQLVKDGMEDDSDLVDASAKLDREWDDWKDQNPRGSGNKRGDVGDRNF